MAIGLQVWSQTPNSNATSDTNINWAEGMAPSAVNDSARSVMASAARWRDDNNGTIVTSGTTLAYTAVTNQVEAALTAGYTVTLQFHASNDSSATLAVDGLTAKPLQMYPGKNIGLAQIPLGGIQRFTYSSTGTGQWVANNAVAIQPVSATALGGVFTTTSVGTFVMAGYGAAFAFTPLVSTRCLISVNGYCYQSVTLGNSMQIKLYYGTGTAPVAGAAATGTQVPGTTLLVATSDQLGYALPFSFTGIASGLAIGTAYWVDIQFATGAGTGNMPSPAFSALEIT